jgi:hypothetical protein
MWKRWSQPRPMYHRPWALAMTALLCGAVVLMAVACAPPRTAGTRYGIGQTAEVNGWRVIVHSFALLPDAQDRQPNPDHVFCAVEVTLENLNSKIRFFMPERQMLLRDASGTVYELDHNASVVAARSRQWMVPEGEMGAEETAQGAASYQVPATAEGLSWIFRSSLFPWAATLTFDLGAAPR